MHGNVSEWCQDSYQSSYQGAPGDGSAWEVSGASDRVNRGGGWYNDNPWGCRAAYRHRLAGLHRTDLGFRPAR